jgi:hypothetical protein
MFTGLLDLIRSRGRRDTGALVGDAGVWLPPGGVILARTVGDIVEDLRRCTVKEMEAVIQVRVSCEVCRCVGRGMGVTLHVHLYVYVYVYVHVYVYVYVFAYVSMYLCMCMRMCMRMGVCMCVCMYVHEDVRVYVYVCVCECVHILPKCVCV